MTRFLTSYVHVDGVAYPTGMSEAEVGAAAGQIGDHAWRVVEDGPAEGILAPAEPAASAPELQAEPEVVPAVEPEPLEVEPSEAEVAPDVEPAADPGEVSDGVEPDTEVKPPARRGPGSSETAWREYALKVGVHVDAANDRAEVIALIEAAGKPV